MKQEFPPPPNAAEFSEMVKRRLDDVRNAGGTRETVTVDWNGQPLHCEVIDCPISSVFYNPGTHRIRAQRSHNPAKDAALEADPWSGGSQEYLQFLLQADPADPNRRDPDFDKLKESLEQFGQNDPGLITHHGILVNGNTRTAALRELGRQTMRVGVLPESFTWDDINAVELALQLRRDHRRDYSYINRLLAMEEQAGLGRTPEAIAKDFRIRPSTYHQERWILSTIREQISRSGNGDGAGLRLVDFEDHQEKLKELHRAYEKLAAVDPDRADVLKELRMAAIVMGFAKTDVRHIDESFRDRYLSRTMHPSFSEPACPPAAQENPRRSTGWKVGIVDERSEIAASERGVPRFDLGPRTDVLDACPKAEGMMMMIRSMSPEVLIVDEIGRCEDAEAIREALHAGIRVIATAHGRNLDDVKRRPALGGLFESGVFGRYVILGRSAAGGRLVHVLDGEGRQLAVFGAYRAPAAEKSGGRDTLFSTGGRG